MSAIRFLLATALAVLFFSQIVMSRPDGATDDVTSNLKTVEAKVSVAFDDMKKGLTDLFQNISTTLQSEMAKHPEAAQMYNSITQNITTGIQDMMKQLQSAGAPAATAKP